MKPPARLWRTVDPRRSIRSRLLFGFFLAFLIPGAVFVLVLSRKLTALQEQSLDRLASLRRVGGSAPAGGGDGFRRPPVDDPVRVVAAGACAPRGSARVRPA